MRFLKELALKIPQIKKLKDERDSLLQGYTHVPPGHFYSPIPSLDDIRSREDKIWGSIPENLPGIDLNTEKQLNYFREFVTFYKEMPFTPQKNPSLRYFFNNPAYSYSDAICLYSMIRKAKPKKIIEVGSGYSSCVMMDTNEIFFQNGIDIAFIEPYTNLFSLMKEGDRSKYRILPKTLQNVELDFFRELSEDDILFIDSTHVSKVGSDVNAIIFDILPSLSKGVLVHFHDVFYPFEYNKEWIYQGIAWNEAYILKAFLQYNNAFEIVFFNTYLEYFYREQFEKWMPLCLMNPGGSIWLRKTS
ncbi:MAG: class I SAM-dependent methyltransferase [Thermodesulfovibrionales bacterium]